FHFRFGFYVGFVFCSGRGGLRGSFFSGECGSGVHAVHWQAFVFFEFVPAQHHGVVLVLLLSIYMGASKRRWILAFAGMTTEALSCFRRTAARHSLARAGLVPP